MHSAHSSASPSNAKKPLLGLTAWIFIGMATGLLLGIFFPTFAVQFAPVSNIFLRLIKSIVAPLIFGALVYGVAGAGDIKQMGRIGLKAIVYFEILTTAALFVGLGAVNLVKPGLGLTINKEAKVAVPATKLTGADIAEHTFPTSVIDSMARGDVLQIVVFAIIFGISCAALGSKAKAVTDFCESLTEVMFKYTSYVMYAAPFGVGAAMAVAIGKNGIGVLLSLSKLVGTLYGALIFFVVFAMGSVILIAKIPLKRFYMAVRQPWLLAFSTASSEAALPLALENMEAFGVPKHIVAFVLPTGYSFNLDGSTLYLSLAAMFVAQAAGVHMPLPQQLLMMLTLMLSSKGVAAVPRASLIVLSGTLASFDLPVEGIAIILGVDALMDMARTSVNVLGNCLASAVVARWEGVDLKALHNKQIETQLA
jgi:proton glutamate symport protein